MPALIITDAARLKIAELRAFASANPLSAINQQKAADQDMRAFRDMMRMHAIYIPIGFHVVYTHEIQPYAPPPGVFHHISVSVDRAYKLPYVQAVEMILEEFGMLPIAQSKAVWVEDISDEEKAVNVLQLIEVAP